MAFYHIVINSDFKQLFLIMNYCRKLKHVETIQRRNKKSLEPTIIDVLPSRELVLDLCKYASLCTNIRSLTLCFNNLMLFWFF